MGPKLSDPAPPFLTLSGVPALSRISVDFWSILGSLLAPLWLLWAPVGALLAPPWALLAPFWTFLDQFWDPFRSNLKNGCKNKDISMFLAPFWTFLG